MSVSSAASAIHFSCAICNYVYDSSARRPLVLPCSHSFCQSCLQQLEASHDQLCPICRGSWSSHSVADFTSCYQLIPAETRLLKVAVSEQPNANPSYPDICVEHSGDYIFWCATCDVPVCKICWKLNHKACEVLLMEEQCQHAQQDYAKSVDSLREANQSKLPRYLADNKSHIKRVRDLREKLKLLEKQLLRHHESLNIWRSTAEDILSEESISSASTLRDILEIRQKTKIFKNLELGLSTKATPVLLQMIDSYQEKPDIGSVEDGEAGDSTARAAYKPNPLLPEGGVWVIANEASANAVHEQISISSIRPSRLKITWTSIRERHFGFICCNPKLLQVELELDCFSNFGRTSREDRSLCASLLNALKRCWVTQFWGHLNIVGLPNLPKTIQSLGLVVRDEHDIATLNNLYGKVFKVVAGKSPTASRDSLAWSDWTELNVSIASTFRPELWRMDDWVFYKDGDARTTRTLLTVLPALGVRLRLFLHQLTSYDMRWIRLILLLMDISFPCRVPLFLPDASLDPDILLGVLRDSGQLWEVHLPAGLPQLVPREEITERYKTHGHSVAFDLPWREWQNCDAVEQTRDDEELKSDSSEQNCDAVGRHSKAAHCCSRKAQNPGTTKGSGSKEQWFKRTGSKK